MIKNYLQGQSQGDRCAQPYQAGNEESQDPKVTTIAIASQDPKDARVNTIAIHRGIRR
jgi:hypothetical protein